MFRALAVLALALTSADVARAQATIAGVVLDQEGAPVPYSSVEAFPVQDGGFVGNLAWEKADDRGNFSMNLREGRYEIRAKDESEGYPDPNALLSVDPSALFPEVTVSRQDILGVRVKLGPKGGILEGDVRDRVTQSPVPKAKVKICDSKRPGSFVEVFTDRTGHFQFTVPSRSLLISAVAQGYENTRFDKGNTVTLSAGERRSVVLELEPR
jgi:hypothetical protein